MPTSEVNGFSVINVAPASSGEHLREELDQIANANGLKTTALVSMSYTFSVNNKQLFQEPLKKPRKKGGLHIGARVTTEVADGLAKWAKRTSRSRGYLCCYILEKIIEDNLVATVINSSTELSSLIE